MHANRLEPDELTPCEDRGLWCTARARWLVAGRRLCTPCKRVADEAAPHSDTLDDEACP